MQSAEDGIRLAIGAGFIGIRPPRSTRSSGKQTHPWHVPTARGSRSPRGPRPAVPHQKIRRSRPSAGADDLPQGNVARAQAAAVLFSVGRCFRVAKLYQRNPRRDLRDALDQTLRLPEVVGIEHHLHVGTIDARKNRQRVVQAIEKGALRTQPGCIGSIAITTPNSSAIGTSSFSAPTTNCRA